MSPTHRLSDLSIAALRDDHLSVAWLEIMSFEIPSLDNEGALHLSIFCWLTIQSRDLAVGSTTRTGVPFDRKLVDRLAPRLLATLGRGSEDDPSFTHQVVRHFNRWMHEVLDPIFVRGNDPNGSELARSIHLIIQGLWKSIDMIDIDKFRGIVDRLAASDSQRRSRNELLLEIRAEQLFDPGSTNSYFGRDGKLLPDTRAYSRRLAIPIGRRPAMTNPEALDHEKEDSFESNLTMVLGINELREKLEAEEDHLGIAALERFCSGRSRREQASKSSLTEDAIRCAEDRVRERSRRFF